MPQPFKLGWNLRIRGREIPISAVVGLISTMLIWVVILITQPYSRWVGLGWMVVGVIIYYFYQRNRKKSSDILISRPKNR